MARVGDAGDVGDEGAVRGFHHVTLVCADAQRTVDFYSGVLGLRLVKRTVNFDDPGSYHLYFGDELGAPGTILTFFEWPRSPIGAPGIGGTHHLALAVSGRDALLRWKRRLMDLGREVRGPYARRGYEAVSFCDPDGAILELAAPIAHAPEPGEAAALEDTAMEPVPGLLPPMGTAGSAADPPFENWPEAVPEILPGMELAAGLHHVALCTADLEQSAAFYGDLLGWRRIRRRRNPDDPEREQWTFASADGPAGAWLVLTEVDAHGRRAALGVGQTHHIAFAVADAESQLVWRQRLVESMAPVSKVLDRVYFRSIYTRDPDGHIVELATLGPGFEADEPAAELGTTLCLPPWLEANRDALTRQLRPLRSGRAERPPAIHRNLRERVRGPHEGLPVLLGGAPLPDAAGGTAPSAKGARAAMVLLHGRGASAGDILQLGEQIARSVPGLALVAPQAAGSTWYPYSFLASLDSNEPELSSALAALEDALARVTDAGIPAERTMLLGFSQGACLALEFAARHARRYGAVAGLSGGLIGPPGTPRAYAGSLAGTPVLLGCDEQDPHIPRGRVEESAKVLERLGGDVTMWIYSGLGHAVNSEELEWVRAHAAELVG